MLICLPVINFPMWLSGSLIDIPSCHSFCDWYSPPHPCRGVTVLIKWTGGMCRISSESQYLKCSSLIQKMRLWPIRSCQYNHLYFKPKSIIYLLLKQHLANQPIKDLHSICILRHFKCCDDIVIRGGAEELI